MTIVIPALTLHIAGIEFEIHGVGSLAALDLPARFAEFQTPLEAPCLHTDVVLRDADPAAVPVGEKVFDPGSVWRVYRHPYEADGWAICVGYPQENGLSPVQATLHANADWSRVTLTEPAYDGVWKSLLGVGVGELLVRARTLFAEGLVFHASCIDDNGSGIMFVGHSGAGKSTQALLWTQQSGVIAMNDDRIVVRTTEQGAMAYGTPWGGTADIACNHRAPLRAIVVLEQAPENALMPLAPADAAAQLLPRSFLPYWDALLMTRAMAQLHRLLGEVPVYRLRCRPEPAVITLVRAAL